MAKLSEKENSILEKVRGLLSKTVENGASEAEALSASKLVQKLLSKYNLSLSQVDMGEEPTVNEDGEKCSFKWQYMLAHVVAKNMCCKGFMNPTIKTYVFIGMEVHRQSAMETFRMLRDVCEKEWRSFLNNSHYNGRTRGLKNDFCMAFIGGVNAGLQEQCHALALVVPEQTEKYTKEKHPSMRSANIRTSSAHSQRAMSAGHTAGWNASRRKQLK